MAVSLADAIVFLKTDDKDLDSGLKKGETKVQSWGGRVGSVAATALKDAMVSAGLAAAAAIAQVGIAAFKVSQDTRAAAADMAASLGIPIEEAERFAEVAREVYRNNFAADVSEAGRAVAEVARQIKLTSDDPALQTIVENAFRVKSAFDLDVAESITTVRTLMQNFGVDSDTAFDFIVAGYQRGLDSSGDFIDSVNEYGPQFGDAGADIDEFFSLLETGLQGGVLGTDKAADAFGEFRKRIIDGSDTTANALQAIGLNSDEITEKIDNGSLTISQAFQLVIEALQKTDDKSIVVQAGVGLMGSQFEDMGETAVLNIDMTTTKLGELEGSMDRLTEKPKSFGERFSAVWRQITDALTPVTDELLLLAEDIMPGVEGAGGSLGKLLGWLAQNIFVPLIREIRMSITQFKIAADQASGFGDRVRSMWAQVQSAIGQFNGLNRVAGFLSAGFRALFSPLERVRTLIQLFNNPIQTVIAMVQNLVGSWSGAFNRIVSVAQNAWNGVRAGANSVIGAVSAVGWRIRGAFNFNLWSVGFNAVAGLANGIWAGASRAINAAVSVARSALNAAKRALGSDSPSKVARDEVGITIPQGIAEGIKKGIPEVRAALELGLGQALNVSPGPVAAGGGSISIVQNFHGAADSSVVRDAAQQGVRSALRRAGVQ